MKNLVKMYVRAWQIARKFNHGWASAFESEAQIIELARKCRSIKRFVAATNVAAAPSNWEYGWITCPTPMASGPYKGHLVETTGTGRCRWEIDPSGSVFVRIARPAGDAMWATILWPEMGWDMLQEVNVPGRTSVGIWEAGPDYVPLCTRHIDALNKVLRALNTYLPNNSYSELSRIARMGDAMDTLLKEQTILVDSFVSAQKAEKDDDEIEEEAAVPNRW